MGYLSHRESKIWSPNVLFQIKKQRVGGWDKLDGGLGSGGGMLTPVISLLEIAVPPKQLSSRLREDLG